MGHSSSSEPATCGDAEASSSSDLERRLGIVDLHSHFPMHIDASVSVQARDAMLFPRGLPRSDRIRAAILRFACKRFNFERRTRKDGKLVPSVTPDTLAQGRVAVALSVLYQPFDEMDIQDGFPEKPKADYFRDLVAEVERVEGYARDHASKVCFARNPSELEKVIASRRVALIHAVEGGFHFGATVDEIDRNVAELAGRGVGYVTVAHLFWRGIATNVPALPFLPDWFYNFVFRQPDEGLSDLGKALVRAMERERIVVDLTHMSERGMNETLALLRPSTPVFATHIACRQPKGHLAYNLSDAMIQRIAHHGGVMGTIVCEHFASDGRPRPRTFPDSVDAIAAQIDRITELTGGYDHIGIGTDMDGFIKPTLPGLESASALALLESALYERYPDHASKICHGNALRILRTYWRGRG